MTKNTNIGLNQSIETQDYIGFYNRMAAEF